MNVRRNDYEIIKWSQREKRGEERGEGSRGEAEGAQEFEGSRVRGFEGLRVREFECSF